MHRQIKDLDFIIPGFRTLLTLNNIWIGTESGEVNILDKNTGNFTYMIHDE
jgi:hypothetical protein